MADTRNLKWPYLRTMVHRSRTFRIDSDMEQAFANLRQSLDGYTAWCSRGSPERLAKLDEWADAVYQGCRQNCPERCSPILITTQPLRATLV